MLSRSATKLSTLIAAIGGGAPVVRRAVASRALALNASGGPAKTPWNFTTALNIIMRTGGQLRGDAHETSASGLRTNRGPKVRALTNGLQGFAHALA
jgi:hypothetical protein